MGSSKLSFFSSPSPLSKRAAYWTLLCLGGGLSGTMLLDVYVDWARKGEPLWAPLLENVVPVGLALTLVYAARTAYQRDEEAARLAEMAKWALTGCVGMALLSGPVLWLHVFPKEIHLGFFALQMGSVGGVAGLWVGHHIAGFRQAKRTMENKRDRLKRLFEGIPSPVVHGAYEDGELTVLSVNPAFEKRFGYSAEKIEGQDLYELVVPEGSREDAAEIDRQALQQGGVSREVRRLAAEGPRNFYLRVAPALNHDSAETYAVYTDVTEQKRRESELRLFKEVVAQANDAILVTEAKPLDEPGPRIEFANAAFEEMTGYSQEELQGKTPRILQGPETDREVLDSLREALENGEAWAGETVNYRKDGEPYHLRWSIAPVRDEEGDVEHWMSVQRDVTERREREQTLRRQRNLLEQTQRLAGAWEADLSSGEMTWSEKAYAIHEVEPGTPVRVEEGIEFYAPEARPKIREALERCIEEGKPYDLELPIITAEGTRRWVRTVGAPAEEKDGAILKVAGAFQDITDRKEKERERRILAAAVEQANDSIVITDARPPEKGGPRLIYANATFEQMWGYDVEEAVEAPPTLVMGPETEEEVLADLTEHLRAGRPWQGTMTNHRKDGSSLIAEWSVAPIKDQENELTHWVSVQRDVTEEHRRKEALRAAKEEAEEAARLKSALLANVSHEIRTPLTAITGFSQMLKEELEGEQRFHATKIFEGSRRLQRTLDAILQLSRLEAGQKELDRELVSLGGLAQEVVAMLDQLAAEKCLTVETEIPSAPVRGRWNEDAVHRICRNLVENAIKFTPETGQIEVRVREEGEEAVFEVQDTGIGMAPEKVPELFKAFKQESEGLGREYEGTGLGLSIVKRLTEELGGTIGVETEKGEGTCVTVRLPKTAPSAEESIPS